MQSLRLLILEKSELDSQAVVKEIASGGYEVLNERVDSIPELLKNFEDSTWDLIIVGHYPPLYSAFDALRMIQETGIDIPFIILSNNTDEGMAVEAMRSGAHDYVLKGNLKRLLPAIEREIQEKSIRSAYRRADETIRYQSYHDSLTHLPNRSLFFDRLQQVIHTAKRENKTFSVLLITVNRFKSINEELGHINADLLLRQLAIRLRAMLRQTDTIARMDGVEFAVILNLISNDQALTTGRKLLAAIEKPFFIDARNYYINVNMGVVFYPKHGFDVDSLISNADIAMQSAKGNNGGFLLYHSSQSSRGVKHRALASDLQYAISNNELMLYFQPKVEMATGKVCSVETLLRWNHPEYGFISPEEFIPLAEQTDIIKPLTGWVMKHALDQYMAWKEAGLNIHVAINISMKNLTDPDCHDRIGSLFNKYDIPAGEIELELTETTMMDDPQTALHMMNMLNEKGIIFSIDDFGTGYSSLSYLKRLPVKILKIDKSFIQNMINDENDAVIVRATIDLAHNIGLKVVAEGVEDRATWDLLEILRCDIIQGYYVSRPMPAEALYDWLTEIDQLFILPPLVND